MTEPVRRSSVLQLANLMLVGFVALAAWLFRWQVLEHDRFEELSLANHRMRASVPARRGTISDIHGTVLAASEPMKTVCVDPFLGLVSRNLDPYRIRAAKAIAKHLELDEEVVIAKTTPKWFTNAAGRVVADRYEILRHEVPLEAWEALTNELADFDFGIDLGTLSTTNRQTFMAMRTKLVYSQDDFLRRYPCEDLAPHVIGFTHAAEVNRVTGPIFEEWGEHGVERRLDDVLKGTAGWRLGLETVEARPGLNVVLTLDSSIQRIVQDHLRRLVAESRARGGVAVLVRPQTGDVLAMASMPDFSPTNPANLAGHRNLAIAELLEPGSTMKAITFAEAAEKTGFSWERSVFCNHGVWLTDGARMRDFHGYGDLTWREVLMKSSNIGTSKIADLLIPIPDMIDALQRFGFGERSGIHLPGEVSGLVNRPQRRMDYHRIVFGQFVSTTPLQMTMAYAALANEGRLMRPRLVDRIEDETGQVLVKFPPMVVRQAVSPAAAASITEGLTHVVSVKGTGHNAELELHTVAGKTGTAEIYDRQLQAYPPGKDYPSFVGYLPASRPEICLLVGLIEPGTPGRHGGGKEVAPTWKLIAEQVANYLRIPPDKLPNADLNLPGAPEGTWPTGPIAARRSSSVLGSYYR
ncbi:MAG: penicillin-binding protein 2 [Verrucomicrobiales bacterium]|nr:penicillin-binding protein 2 [Verrucomicrobiales bacterium]